ncbi:MAG: hypothetical protein IKV14_05230 [Muribaculaceae bacterium]|nr:hypothetical protein [Muribaculaceae bacterium]
MLEEDRLLLSESPEITITAMKEGLDAKLKTIRESDGSVEWCPMDEISVFYENGGNGGNKFTAQNTEQTDIAEFKGRIEGFIAGGENFTNGRYLYGVYPYSTKTSFNNGVTTISLPFNQTAVEGTFANGLFPTIARAKGVDLAFYNICGGIKFTVSKENIVSVKFRGNKKERLAGTAKVVFDSSEKPALLDESADAKEEIIVYAPAGGTFEVGKEYYIVSYPTELTSGYTLTFRTSDNKEGAYVSNDAVEIKRSIFGVLKDLDKNISSWTEAAYGGGGGENSGVYLGIMGFNQQLYSFPMSHLNSQNKEGFDSFIDDLNMKYGTLLYYSVDQTISAMQSVPLPADLSTVAIVTFTDGLDQGSIMMNTPFSSSVEYLNAIGNRIKNEKVGGQPITAYSIGIRGDDVKDVTTFRNNISKLASSEENAIEVTSMSEVNAKFKEIAEQLSKSNYVQTVSLAMPGMDSGTVMRFTFDNVNSAEKSSLYIEGTFNKSTYTFENVKYEGLTSTSGTEIKGTADGIFVKFVFEGVQTADNKLINKDFTAEWYYIPSSNIWQVNGEFNRDENSEIVTERSSAAIMLVLDCSSSLGSDFVKAQTNAKDFINTLYNAVGGDGDLEENPSQNDNYIYSTTPKDLSLSIWKGGTRYYLTKDEYSKADLSDAQIEGLTIVAGGESFVLSLQDVLSDPIAVRFNADYFSDILPTETQGKFISAKWSDINAAISSFGGTLLTTSKYYWTSSTSSNSSYSYTNCISGSGGNLYGTNNYPYVRGVKPTNHNSAIYWRDPNDLKLSVIINGNREFLDKQEYNERRSEIDEVEGVAVIAVGEKFAIHLNDAQSAYISSIATAKLLYGGIMPTGAQAQIIGAKWSDINAAISSFGGTQLQSSKYYYTSSTSFNSSYSYTYCIHGYGGWLWHTNNPPYVRGVTKIE